MSYFQEDPNRIDFIMSLHRNNEKVTTVLITSNCRALYSYGTLEAVIIEDKNYKNEFLTSKTTERHIREFFGRNQECESISLYDMRILIAKHIYNNIIRGLVL